MSKKKPAKASSTALKRGEIVKTNLTFEELMKKALTTPLPIKAKKAKKK